MVCKGPFPIGAIPGGPASTPAGPSGSIVRAEKWGMELGREGRAGEEVGQEGSGSGRFCFAGS